MIYISKKYYTYIKYLSKSIYVLLCITLVISSLPSSGFALRPPASGLSADTIPLKDENKEFFKTIDSIAEAAYKDKRFLSGDTYLDHVEKVADILKKLRPDIDKLAVAAALLHRAEEFLEKQKKLPLSKKDRNTIMSWVENMNKVSRILYNPPDNVNFAIMNHMNAIIQMADTDEVMSLVFADKMENLETASGATIEYICREIMHIYAPLAERFGLSNLARDLRREVFKKEEPDEYEATKKVIEKKLGMNYDKAIEHLEDIKRKIEEKLPGLGIKATVFVRVKDIYSVYNKMAHMPIDNIHEPIDSIHDLFGIRIVFKDNSFLENISNISSISNILELISSKEYIEGESEHKRQSDIGYEAFHHGIRDEQGRPYEFQFMDEDNHRKYINGIAAHWSYKMKKLFSQNFDPDEINLSGDFKKDFKAIKESLSKWVFVFRKIDSEKKCKTNNKQQEEPMIVIKPLRLPAGSIPADIAALRDINELDLGYKGAEIFRVEYDVDTGEFIELLRISRTHIYELMPGDIAEPLKKGPKDAKGLSIRAKQDIRKKAKTLRALILINSLDLQDSKEKKALKKSGQKNLEDILKEAGLSVSEKTNYHDIKVNFFNNLQRGLGLKTLEELYIGAGLETTREVTVEKAKKYMQELGRYLLEQKGLDFRNLDFNITQIPDITSLDQLFFYVGIGKLDPLRVSARLSNSGPVKIRRKPLSFYTDSAA